MRSFRIQRVLRSASLAAVMVGLFSSIATAAEEQAPSAKPTASDTSKAAPAAKAEPSKEVSDKSAEQKDTKEGAAKKDASQTASAEGPAPAAPEATPAPPPPTASQFGVVKMAPDTIKPGDASEPEGHVPSDGLKPEPERAKPYKLVVINPHPKGKEAPEEEEIIVPADMNHLGNFQRHWQVSLGLRVGWISDAALDPFSDEDAFSQLSFGAGRTLFADGPLSVMAMIAFDSGTNDESIRGEDTTLVLQRLSLGPEVRYHLVPRSYLFARLMPGYTRGEAELDDGATNATLSDWSDAFGADLSGGVAYNIIGRSDLGGQARLWLSAEGGYGFGQLDAFHLKPEHAGDVPPRFERPTLDGVSLAGPFARLSAIATF